MDKKEEYKGIADSIPVFCSFDEIVDIVKAIPNPKNPNTHPKQQIDMLARFIKVRGWRNPIVLSTRSGFIVKGHGRLQAAQLLGVKEVPVDYQHFANEAEEYAEMIADNKIAELAEMDVDLERELLEQLIEQENIDPNLIGYTKEEIEAIIHADDDEGTEGERSDGSLLDLVNITVADPKHKTEHWDIWEVGQHILCVVDVIDEWWAWVKFLEEGALFVPYPGPFVPLSTKAEDTKFIMVQPNTYIAGHILDHFAEIYGENNVRKKN